MMNEIINFFSFWKENDDETDFISSRDWRWPPTFHIMNELQEEEMMRKEEDIDE